MNSCECDSEKRERGVGAGVNVTMMFETLQVAGLARRSVQNGDSVEINRHEYSITTVRSRTKNTVCQRRHR
jgi:sorbitol-specific phosphotransferase system component IIA